MQLRPEEVSSLDGLVDRQCRPEPEGARQARYAESRQVWRDELEREAEEAERCA